MELSSSAELSRELRRNGDHSGSFSGFSSHFFSGLISFNPNTDRLPLSFIQSFVQTKKNRESVPTVRPPILLESTYIIVISRFLPIQIPTYLQQVRT